MSTFRRRTLDELLLQMRSIDHPDVSTTVSTIVNDVRRRGETAVREYAGRFDGLAKDSPLVVGRSEMQEALKALAPDERKRLTRVADRIRVFADGQRRSLQPFEIAVPGGLAGHTIVPVDRAGCYAPGGRYPLPSSLLMTALTARAAGVADVWVASPRRSAIMLACAALADADGFLVAGGAQAIAALAFGAAPVPACDVVVGPGNAFVTAAKRLIFGHAGIDALAGPSELVILADTTADPGSVAADLLAQAEHDPWSVPILVTTSESLVERVVAEVCLQLVSLPAAQVAGAALANGGALVVRDLDEGIAACDQLAPEHLHLHVALANSIATRLRNYGALFVGGQSAEVVGDYGAGPNHVLPTGGASRFSGGLSVLSFLRVRTWLSIRDAAAARELFDDAAWFGRLEGLEGHARSAERRIG
jgi:histidinol dehydrogenase